MSGKTTSEPERWFLRRGFPSALARRTRWRGVLPRSAPVLAAWAIVMVLSAVVMAISGDRDVDIDADPTPAQWLTLILFVAIPPAMLLAGAVVSRIRSTGVRRAVAIVAVIAGSVSDWYDDGIADAARDLAGDAAIVAAILIATGTGIGAVLGWSVRVVLSHLRSVGRFMARSLPVVLLTVLVFFNATVWTIAASLDTLRICLLVVLMGGIAIAFLAVGLLDSVQPVLSTPPDLQTVDLSATPFAAMADPVVPQKLAASERANFVLVVVISQVVQMLMLAMVTGAVFFVLGLIVLTPGVLAKLTNGAPTQSVWFDITFPVATAHVHITIFLTALTFMYVCARAVSDTEYRATYLDPLLDDLRLVIVARNRYRSAAC